MGTFFWKKGEFSPVKKMLLTPRADVVHHEIENIKVAKHQK